MVFGPPRVTWQQVRELARQIDARAERGEATVRDAQRLARLVVEFDQGLTTTVPRNAKPMGPPPSKTG